MGGALQGTYQIYGAKRDSHYFSQESLNTLLKELTVQEGYWVTAFNVTYSHVGYHDGPLPHILDESRLSNLFGIKLFCDKYYIRALSVEGGRASNPYIERLSDSFTLELKNNLKRDKTYEPVGMDDRYELSWTEVHARIGNDKEAVIEEIVKKAVVPSKFEFEKV